METKDSCAKDSDTLDSHTEDRYTEDLTTKIEFLLYHKSDDFNTITKDIGSVYIPKAREVYDSYISDPSKRRKISEYRSSFTSKLLDARSQTSQFIYDLPAPDSLLSQWWFSLNTIEKIAFNIRSFSGKSPVAFLGSPSVAFFYKKCFEEDVVVFDIDSDIVDVLIKNKIDAHTIDITTESISDEYRNKFKSVFMDPPWYDYEMNTFTDQAASITQVGGYIFASVPSHLTRPGVVDSRHKYIKYFTDMNMQLLSIDSNYFEYSIPAFENIVLSNTNSDISRPWRKSDLLVVQTTSKTKFMSIDTHVSRKKITSFYLPGRLNQFRVFLKNEAADTTQVELFHFVENFSKEISARFNDQDKVHMWTSNQIGFSIKNYDLAKAILTNWQAGKTIKEICDQLEDSCPTIRDELAAINKISLLWPESTSNSRRTPQMILASIQTSPLAIVSGKRRHEQTSDGFRLEFQRDRDRVIWSESFRKLANKCQVFSFDHDEISTVRTRLTHSIEVMQLASTIGNSFGLNKDLIEAGALCHDIGHTPFGHGGENALNTILNEFDANLGGFNHYEHGLDVVEYIENPYTSIALGGFQGLNLMPETLECIAKHTFSKNVGAFSQDSVYNSSKYKLVLDNKFGSLESQTVRIADKISYMLSDIEDGAKMGAIQFEDVIKCRLFNKAPIDMNTLLLDNSPNSFYNLFVSQRRSILKIIMEDVLTASEKSLTRIQKQEEIKNADEYLIRFSADIQDCLDEVWEKLQSGLLHKDSRVEAANFRAKQITSALFYLYAFYPKLIDANFKRNHKILINSEYMKFYYEKLDRKIGIAKHKVSQYNFNPLLEEGIKSVGDNYEIPTYNVILAKDYIASLTDQSAIKEYHKHFSFT